MKNSIIALLIFVIIGGVWHFTKAISDCQSEVASLTNTVVVKDNNNSNLITENRELVFDLKEANSSIKRMEIDISLKTQEINGRKKALKESEAKISKLEDTLLEIYRGGGPKEYTQYLDSLEVTLKQLRKSRDKLVIKNNKLTEQIAEAQRKIIEVNRAAKRQKEVTIPNLEDQIDSYQKENEILKRSYNLRAEVSSFNLDFDRNTVNFYLEFDEDELDVLKDYGNRSITLVPTFTNRNNVDAIWTVDPKSDFETAFQIPLNQLSPKTPISYYLHSINLKKDYKNRLKRINLSKCDRISMEICVKELSNLSICNYEFPIRRR